MKSFKLQLTIVTMISIILACMSAVAIIIENPFDLAIFNIIYIVWSFSVAPAFTFAVRYIKRNNLWEDTVANIFFLGIILLLVPIIIAPILMLVYYIDTINMIKLNNK